MTDTSTSPPPGPSLGLLTDLYQLTMAAGYLESGMAGREAVFSLFFRENPFGGGYAVACGLEQLLHFLDSFRFTSDDLDYLAREVGNDGKPLFPPTFLEHLAGLEFACDLDAVPEGRVVFPQEPLLRVRGPLLQCQLLETAFLTHLNFATLVATKAARICRVTDGPVIEFGLRRAQGPDGGLTAARAAYVGGCVGTSNVLAGKRFGLPVMGTHAHSWVMSFETEPEAFDTYARALPNNCIFLVDTYDTLEGVKNAIRAAEKLREEGHEMIGIRLDSGDFLKLSRATRELLDAAGFPDAKIVASGDLDEYRIRELEEGGARIDVWGVGTRLTTAYDQPALGGVYKLAAWRESGDDEGDTWHRVMKLSEERSKATHPGVQQVRRLRGRDGFVADVLYDETLGLGKPLRLVDAEGLEIAVPEHEDAEDLLVPVARDGEIVYAPPPIAEVRERTATELDALPLNVRRLDSPRAQPVHLDAGLYEVEETLRRKLEARIAGDGEEGNNA